MEFDTDIVIAGGGLNGPALALALSQSGLRVCVVDPMPGDTHTRAAFDGRSYALAQGSINVLNAIGVWDNIVDMAEPILGIQVGDGLAGDGPSPMGLSFDHAELEEGPMGHMVEDRHLRPAFLSAMDTAPNVTVVSGDGVVDQAVTGAGVTATLSSGRTLTARLLVGCDGKNSGVAARAGIKRAGWPYKQTALVCAIAHERPHNGIAHQFFMPAGPLAILPLQGNRSSIVWSEDAALAKDIAALDDDGFMAALRPRFGDFLGEIQLDGARFTYPLALGVAEHFVAPRIALVGDAAHGVHPIAGQGLNLGLRDVGALVEVLVQAKRRGEDFAAIDVLQRYESWRRFDSTALGLGMDAVNRLFSNDNPILRMARGLGMGTVNAVPDLRRVFMREAAGLSGDRPKLLQGLRP